MFINQVSYNTQKKHLNEKYITNKKSNKPLTILKHTKHTRKENNGH